MFKYNYYILLTPITNTFKLFSYTLKKPLQINEMAFRVRITIFDLCNKV